MKYKIEKKYKKEDFIPFSITIDNFHDNVAGVLTNHKPHQFIADVLYAGRDEIQEATGTF